MAILAQKTIVGTIGNVYELRRVGQANSAVIDFSVAVTPRQRKAGTQNEWEDGTTLWVHCTAWNKLAENISESFKKGDRVFVIGREEQGKSYVKDGEERQGRVSLVADFAGLELSYSTATSNRKPGAGSSETAAPARKAAPAASKPAPADDLDLDLDIDNLGDDDDDLGF